MPLQYLVEYFNDRLGREHRSSVRPFILEAGKVSGLFGTVRVDSILKPLRNAFTPSVIVGHAARMNVATNTVPHLYVNKIKPLVTNNNSVEEAESIINFDRLSRTVHMLNYLTIVHLEGVLFLDVDPRHILGVKQDHGAYFEEVIRQCGLETNNVAIVLTLNSQYAPYYEALAKGLENYRHRGYQIALKFDYIVRNVQTFSLIERIAPQYVIQSARNLIGRVHSDELFEQLSQFNAKIASLGAQSILEHIEEKKFDALARNSGFDLVDGDYYNETLTDPFEDSDASQYAVG